MCAQADQDKYLRNKTSQDGYFNIKEAESAKGMEVTSILMCFDFELVATVLFFCLCLCVFHVYICTRAYTHAQVDSIHT